MKTPHYRQQLEPVELPAHLIESEGWQNKFNDNSRTNARILNVVNYQKTMSRFMSGLNDIRVKRNPAETVEGHIQKIGKQAGNVAKREGEMFRTATDSIKARKNEIESHINSDLRGFDHDYLREVRSVLRAMPESERVSIINQSLTEGDKTLAAALITGKNDFLFGLKTKAMTNFREAAKKVLYPEQFEELSELDKATDLLSATRESFVGIYEQFAPSDTLNTIDKEAEASAVAFDKLMNMAG